MCKQGLRSKHNPFESISRSWLPLIQTLNRWTDPVSCCMCTRRRAEKMRGKVSFRCVVFGVSISTGPALGEFCVSEALLSLVAG